MFELYGIAGLTFFSRSFSVIYFKCALLRYDLALAAVFGFSSFWLTVLGKRRSVTVYAVPFVCKEHATKKNTANPYRIIKVT